jgi:hypothetical protein
MATNCTFCGKEPDPGGKGARFLVGPWATVCENCIIEGSSYGPDAVVYPGECIICKREKGRGRTVKVLHGKGICDCCIAESKAILEGL